MNVFDISVKKLYGVGDAKANKYASLGIYSVYDLLVHYPRGYEDRGNIKLIADNDGVSKGAYLLTVATQPNSVRLKGRMSLTKFKVFDESATCEIVFFNQEYLKNTFVVGQTFRFYGKIEKKNGKYSMTSPAYETWDENADLAPLVSVYPLTEGLTQKQIAKDMRSALTLMSISDTNDDPLPEEIRRKYSLCARSYAIRNIHFPDSFSTLAAAKKRLIFDEFFDFALGLMISTHERKRDPAFACATSDLKPFTSQLPYSLTGAQTRVIDEIRADMSKDTAMNRMVIGDVGSGKTVCAAAAMLFAVQSGHQAALMTPTEILARQHFESLNDIFSSMGIKCVLLLGATTAAQKKKYTQDFLRTERIK